MLRPAVVLADRGDAVVLITRDADITESGLVTVIW
jgi:hypothetical protein